jgi:hypothetical protein
MYKQAMFKTDHCMDSLHPAALMTGFDLDLAADKDLATVTAIDPDRHYRIVAHPHSDPIGNQADPVGQIAGYTDRPIPDPVPDSPPTDRYHAGPGRNWCHDFRIDPDLADRVALDLVACTDPDRDLVDSRAASFFSFAVIVKQANFTKNDYHTIIPQYTQ